MQVARCHFIYLETLPHITPKHSFSSAVTRDCVWFPVLCTLYQGYKDFVTEKGRIRVGQLDRTGS